MMRHFTVMRFPTIGRMAQTPLGNLKQMMRLKFGKNSDIQAELFWRIANRQPRAAGDSLSRPKSVMGIDATY
jgi:DNA polymerase-4